MEAPWETGGSRAVALDNHVRFTAMCFNVLKERAHGDEGVIVVLRFPRTDGNSKHILLCRLPLLLFYLLGAKEIEFLSIYARKKIPVRK
jgi:hypothetical protein